MIYPGKVAPIVKLGPTEEGDASFIPFVRHAYMHADQGKNSYYYSMIDRDSVEFFFPQQHSKLFKAYLRQKTFLYQLYR